MRIHVANTGRLYLADTNNNRVLFWNSAANKPNGEPADGVIGQPDYFTITPWIGTFEDESTHLRWGVSKAIYGWQVLYLKLKNKSAHICATNRHGKQPSSSV